MSASVKKRRARMVRFVVRPFGLLPDGDNLKIMEKAERLLRSPDLGNAEIEGSALMRRETPWPL